MWARLSIHNESPVYIASYYRPTFDYSVESNTTLQSSLRHISHITRNNTHARIIVGGDFNAGDIDWNSCKVRCPYVQTKKD